MFNWTTTTIINSLEDYTTGLPLIRVWNGPASVDAEGNAFTEDPKVAGFSGVGPVIKIKRDHTFEGRYISTVYKAIANNPILCEMSIDASALYGLVKEKPAHLRLSFYVSLEGSEESIYANDWYQKGKPFSIGFDVTENDDAASIAAKVKKNAEKYGVVMYGKKVFDLSVDGTTLTLKGTHEYQRIKMAAVTLDDGIDEKLVDFYEDGVDKVSEGKVFTRVERGLNGFGTYHQLVKDLRLPTVHHNKWLQIKEDEKPVVGAKYNQYIITYCAPSMANPGFTVVGQHNMSLTTHVFWVNQAVDEAFQTELAKVATISVVNKVTSEGGKDVTTKVGAVDTKVEMLDAKQAVITDNKVRTDGGKDYSVNHEQNLVHSEVEAPEGKTSKSSK